MRAYENDVFVIPKRYKRMTKKQLQKEIAFFEKLQDLLSNIIPKKKKYIHSSIIIPAKLMEKHI